ncbi:MAG: NAD(P)(+) transhydrogenase (Re/Si-specific) subunit beta, partial [Deltaproteobacteria bacterium]
MPTVISLLNSYAGLAGSATGFVLSNNVLIIAGALDGASGVILSIIMCKAMNRSMANVLFGAFGSNKAPAAVLAPSHAAASATAAAPTGPVIKKLTPEQAGGLFKNKSKSVIVVPGYGMAAAQAQHAVRDLGDQLKTLGISVKYAIHPVAGRMPGHMNVLLAEANVPYTDLFDMEDINDEFEHTDVALVIGANDVTNPAARNNQQSPIYGMPILNVDSAKTVIVCKRSMSPGFAGIDNELYLMPQTYMLFGDAKTSIGKLVDSIKSGNVEDLPVEAPAAASVTGGGPAVKQLSTEQAADLFGKKAARVIIVPGYGMAAAQAQHAVRDLGDLLKSNGVKVKYAIHPVAGRMPGHMNVLLAEANVPYTDLFDMEDINDEFGEADVALVVGANDVTNPAAKTNPQSPIYGMPILD